MKCPECGNEYIFCQMTGVVGVGILSSWHCEKCNTAVYKTGQQADTEADLHEKITGQRSPALERG